MGGSSKGGSQTSSSSSAPPPEVMANYNNIMGLGNNLINTPLVQYGGPNVAPFTAMQNAAFNNINAAQGSWSPYMDAARNQVNQSTTPLWSQAQQWNQGSLDRYLDPYKREVLSQVPQFSAEAVQQYQDPYNQQVVEATRRNMQENNARQRQDLIGNAISKGAWGGDRAGVAQAELARQQKLADDPLIANLYSQGYGNALAEFNQQQGLKANLLGTGYAGAAGQFGQQQAAQLGAMGQERQLAQNAASLYGQLGTQDLDNRLRAAQAQLGAGGLQQQLAQQYLNIPYQQFQQTQGWPYQNLQFLGGLASSLNPGGGTSTSTQPGPSLISQIGGLATGIGGLVGAFSDRRLKDNIEHVGTKDGIKYYDFTYKGDDTPHRGVMAQEVEKRYPDAVNMVDGYRTVDYSQLPKGIPHFAMGGAVGYADGGVPNVAMSPIPQNQLMPSRGTMAPPPMPQSTGDSGMDDLMAMAKGISGIKDMFKSKGTSANETTKGGLASLFQNAAAPSSAMMGSPLLRSHQSGFGNISTPTNMMSQNPYGPPMPESSPVAGLSSLLPGASATPPLNMGGISPQYSQFMNMRNGGRAYADGGSITDLYPELLDMEQDGDGTYSLPVPDVSQAPIPMTQPQQAPMAAMPSPNAQPQPGIGQVGASGIPVMNETDAKIDPWMALAQAGFATAAGQSPNALTNIGQGALLGVQNLMEQRKAAEAQRYKEELVQSRVDKMMHELEREKNKRIAVYDPQKQSNVFVTQGQFDENPDAYLPTSEKPKEEVKKPIPASALKLQEEAVDAIGISSGIDADMGKFIEQIDQGKLDFGPIKNLYQEGRNLSGYSTEESRNLSTFKASLEKLRNDSLRLNKGVQTEGDSQRAWNELIKNINDKDLVRERLAEIREINKRAVDLQKYKIDTIRENFNAEPLDLEKIENLKPAVGGNGEKKGASNQGGKVKVQTPDGRVGYIPQSDLDELIKAGGKAI